MAVEYDALYQAVHRPNNVVRGDVKDMEEEQEVKLVAARRAMWEVADVVKNMQEDELKLNDSNLND